MIAKASKSGGLRAATPHHHLNSCLTTASLHQVCPSIDGRPDGWEAPADQTMVGVIAPRRSFLQRIGADSESNKWPDSGA